MGAVTKIAWCDHTFNPWWGCTQVSPLCDHRYAMMLDARWYKRAHWGPGAPRRYFGGAHWREPLTWQHAAQAEGRRHSVFCASLGHIISNGRGRSWQNAEHQALRSSSRSSAASHSTDMSSHTFG